jgi:MFS family permease
LFVLYGLYAAATEGLSKAWISNVCDKDETATAIGFYTAFQSIAAMLASTIAGLLWTFVSPAAALGTSAVAAIFAGVYLVTIQQKKIETLELESEVEVNGYDEQMLKRA